MKIPNENQINDFKIKIVPLNKQLIVKRNSNKNLFKKYINQKKEKLVNHLMKNLTSKYNDIKINNDSSSYLLNENSFSNSFNLKNFNKSKILSGDNSSEFKNKTIIQCMKKINLKNLINFPLKSSSTNAYTQNIFSIKSFIIIFSIK